MSEQYYENQEVIDIQDEDVEVVDSNGEPAGSKGLLGLALGIGVGIAVAGVAAWKNRDKIKQKRVDKQIKKLEKKGYVVSKEIPVVPITLEDIAVNENEETDEE